VHHFFLVREALKALIVYTPYHYTAIVYTLYHYTTKINPNFI